MTSVITLFVLQVANVSAQSAPTLELIKRLENSVTEIDSGTFFTYFIQYRCVGITENCRDVVVTDILPPELSNHAEDVVLSGTVHTLSQTYDPATSTATWTFIDPLPAGSTGELRIQVRFPAGVTPDGTIASNQAVIDSSNAPSPVFSNTVEIESNATNQVTAEKGVRGGVVDEDTIYDVRICRPAGSSEGLLNMQDITMVDQLPDGAIFVSTTDGGTYDPVAHTVTWIISEFDVTSQSRCWTRQVVVRFPSSDFDTGDTITNDLTITGTPIGGAETTFGSSVTHDLTVPNDGGSFNKRGTTTEASIGETIRYGFEVQNTGNVALDSFVVRDEIPAALDVTALHTGNDPSASLPIGICIETNLTPTCTAITGSPFTAETNVLVSTLGLQANETIEAIEWEFGVGSGVPIGFRSTGQPNVTAGFSATVLATDRNGDDVTLGALIDNDGTLTYTFGGNPPTVLVDDHIVEVAPSAAVPFVEKQLDSPASVNPGEIINYNLTFGNDVDAASNLVNPVAADLLDSDVIFESWSYSDGGTGIPEPIFEQLDNYQGTGQTLLRWRWEDASAASFSPGQTILIRLTVRIRDNARGGTNAIGNEGYVIDWDDSVPVVGCENGIADSDDLDGDGDTTEEICYSEATAVGINSQAVMESTKSVRSVSDPVWRSFPEIGSVAANGSFEYLLRLTNVGNVDISEIMIVDILPYEGDTGVIDANPRNSEFMPALADQVIAPTDAIVYYSLQSNPCRPDLVTDGPVGCVAPAWQTTPPNPINQVRSIYIDFDTITLQPNESVEIIIPMVATGFNDLNDTAWNSFGYTATRMDILSKLLPTEPFMVGIQVVSNGNVGSGSDDDDDNNDNRNGNDSDQVATAQAVDSVPVDAAGLGSTVVGSGGDNGSNGGLSQDELLGRVDVLPQTGESPLSQYRLPILATLTTWLLGGIWLLIRRIMHFWQLR